MSIKEKLIAILGPDRVDDSPEVLDAYRTDYSLTSPGTPLCVVYPEESKEVQSIVDVSNEQRIPIVPCSSRVHFFGTTLPRQGGIVIDLKNNFISDDIKTIHLIGICGTGMAALACMLKEMGYTVAGSDHKVYPPMSELLARKNNRAV